MIILNTTFFAEETLAAELHSWIKDVYISAARDSGLFSRIEAMRIVDNPQPGAVSYAVHCVAANIDDARRWHDTSAAAVKDALHSRWGERFVWFTTYMEAI